MNLDASSSRHGGKPTPSKEFALRKPPRIPELIRRKRARGSQASWVFLVFLCWALTTRGPNRAFRLSFSRLSGTLGASERGFSAPESTF